MSKKYGKMEVETGERCTNPGQDERFTTPCCYADVSEGDTKCPDCGTAIECTVEQEPVAVCTITEEE